MASSSSSSSGSYVYDVFLSFRGEDTRKTFVDHLYYALEQRHIRTYKDDITLPRGESVGPALLKAIQESRHAVIIFSKNYADSSWCLDELVHIMKCRAENGQIVMPVFYDVDPSDVRKQKGDFGKAFSKQEMKNVNKSWRKLFAKQEVEDTTKVESWKKALVDASNISGWEPKNVANGHESMVIKKIVDTIFGGLFRLNSDIDEGLVGMRDRLQDLISQLEMGSSGVRMVGIWGIGGAGKTTLATSVYMKLMPHFKSHCIIDNIREESRKSGLKKLQGDILSALYKPNIEVHSVAVGKCQIKSMLCRCNVLVILDDVDDIDQLEALAGSHDWFGDGSRIIITTRDEHLLRKHKVDHVSPVRLLADDEAIELFRSHAFNEEKHIKDYEKLSLQVVSYADGLPLALKVLGSFLYDKDAKEWMSTMDRLRDIPESKIVDKLKISYDGLKPVEKELFLDIACFFRGEWKSDTMELFDACGFHPEIGIKVLIQKSLITIDSNGRFGMHDLIQEMGHYIVRGEHPNNPEKHSRVWKHAEVSNMCFGDATVENDQIEAIAHESMVIKKIVDTIFDGLFPLNSDIDEGLVGMRARLQDLISQLEIGSGGVRMVGIWGLGGGGKTTLATSVYMEIIHHFKSHCIIENIREESSKSGLKKLQGKPQIKSMLCHSNVLVILDDVDHLDQLEALAGSPSWFGDGSRIIITTRDEHLLRKHNVDHVSPVRLLSRDEAMWLFNSHAYNEEKHIKDYEKFSLQVVSYADGLPLALKVLGSFLYDKDTKEWMSTMDRLRDIPESEIVDKLKISYDGLKPVEKELFLDIACFFRGELKGDTMEIFDACGFHPEIGIKVLIQKSLITIDSEGKFCYACLIKDWDTTLLEGNILTILKNIAECGNMQKSENDQIEAIEFGGKIYKSTQIFMLISKMKKLRWLRLAMYDEAPNCLSMYNELHYEGNGEAPNCLSNELRYISWENYPASPFPDSFQATNLVFLKLDNSRQELLWKGYKGIRLSRSHRFDPARRSYTDKDQPSIPRIIEVHWFRPALDSSGERPQLPTSVVSYRVSTRDTYYTLTVGVLQRDQ
ncbi:Toll/interleukin-1 receptor domain-containing protein [Tanacetum coccineum]